MAPNPLWGQDDPGIFLELQPADPDSSIKLSDIKLKIMDNFIEKNIGTCKRVTRLRSGNLLLLTSKASQAQKAGKEYSMGLIENDFHVKVVLQDKLNQVKGTVYSKRLMAESIEDLKDIFKRHGVVEVYRISKKVDGKEIATPIHVLTFNKSTLPEKINIVHETLTVKKYYPRPMRCFKCQNFNHTTKNCTAQVEICHQCANEKPHDVCGSIKCHNCSQVNDLKSKSSSHQAGDKNCPAWIREIKIKEIQTDEKVGYMAARSIFFKRFGINQNLQNSKSSAEVVQSAVLDELANLRKEVEMLRRDVNEKDMKIRQYKATLNQLAKPPTKPEDKSGMSEEDDKEPSEDRMEVNETDNLPAVTTSQEDTEENTPTSKKRKTVASPSGESEQLPKASKGLLDDESFIIDDTTMKRLSKNDKKKVKMVLDENIDKEGFIIWDPVKKKATFHEEMEV